MCSIDTTVAVGKDSAFMLLVTEGFYRSLMKSFIALQINKNAIHDKIFLSQCPNVIS